jgi:hypothetical protein
MMNIDSGKMMPAAELERMNEEGFWMKMRSGEFSCMMEQLQCELDF